MPEDPTTEKVSIDRISIEELIKERTQLLSDVERNITNLQYELNRQVEQQIGLKHRIAELTELLK